MSDVDEINRLSAELARRIERVLRQRHHYERRLRTLSVALPDPVVGCECKACDQLRGARRALMAFAALPKR